MQHHNYDELLRAVDQGLLQQSCEEVERAYPMIPWYDAVTDTASLPNGLVAYIDEENDLAAFSLWLRQDNGEWKLKISLCSGESNERSSSCPLTLVSELSAQASELSGGSVVIHRLTRMGVTNKSKNTCS